MEGLHHCAYVQLQVAGPALKMMAYPSVTNMTPLTVAALLG